MSSASEPVYFVFKKANKTVRVQEYDPHATFDFSDLENGKADEVKRVVGIDSLQSSLVGNAFNLENFKFEELFDQASKVFGDKKVEEFFGQASKAFETIFGESKK